MTQVTDWKEVCVRPVPSSCVLNNDSSRHASVKQSPQYIFNQLASHYHVLAYEYEVYKGI